MIWEGGAAAALPNVVLALDGLAVAFRAESSSSERGLFGPMTKQTLSTIS